MKRLVKWFAKTFLPKQVYEHQAIQIDKEIYAINELAASVINAALETLREGHTYTDLKIRIKRISVTLDLNFAEEIPLKKILWALVVQKLLGKAERQNYKCIRCVGTGLIYVPSGYLLLPQRCPLCKGK